jgi:hypothetical protein
LSAASVALHVAFVVAHSAPVAEDVGQVRFEPDGLGVILHRAMANEVNYGSIIEKDRKTNSAR